MIIFSLLIMASVQAQTFKNKLRLGTGVSVLQSKNPRSNSQDPLSGLSVGLKTYFSHVEAIDPGDIGYGGFGFYFDGDLGVGEVDNEGLTLTYEFTGKVAMFWVGYYTDMVRNPLIHSQRHGGGLNVDYELEYSGAQIQFNFGFHGLWGQGIDNQLLSNAGLDSLSGLKIVQKPGSEIFTANENPSYDDVLNNPDDFSVVAISWDQDRFPDKKASGTHVLLSVSDIPLGKRSTVGATANLAFDTNDFESPGNAVGNDFAETTQTKVDPDGNIVQIEGYTVTNASMTLRDLMTTKYNNNTLNARVYYEYSTEKQGFIKKIQFSFESRHVMERIRRTIRPITGPGSTFEAYRHTNMINFGVGFLLN